MRLAAVLAMLAVLVSAAGYVWTTMSVERALRLEISTLRDQLRVRDDVEFKRENCEWMLDQCYGYLGDEVELRDRITETAKSWRKSYEAILRGCPR